jgi:subtilisin family serine protease
MRPIGSKLFVFAFVLIHVAGPKISAQATPDVSHLALPGEPLQTNLSILGRDGDVQVLIQLTDVSLAVAHGKNAKKAGGKMSSAQQRDYLVQLNQKQNALLAQIRALGGRDLGRLDKVLNAVAVSVPSAVLPAVAALPGVRTVRRLRDYRLDLSETVPYIGASAVHNSGFNGAGVRVAVLDTGIDYTHKVFGGAGTAAAYQEAYGTSTGDPRNTTTDGLFPTAKVVGGFDFIGEKWPYAPLAPDPDPIDCGRNAMVCAGGHGTHVADIVAGDDGASHKGVAPGASLYAVKVCSSMGPICSGLALLQGIDFALDPNNDGDVSDAVDVINMSLGSSYGQIQDDLAEAAASAVELGVVVVAAAGNDADRPYVVASPSIAPGVISVGQSRMDSVAGMALTSSRGPSYNFNSIKPDMAAPGTSLSARAGTGTEQSHFGGTSGAAPMISGSAALLIQKHPAFDPLQIKALLMNTAETNIYINSSEQPPVLAPITRIGAGEVRVNRAVASTTTAWDILEQTPSLSFGYDAFSESRSLYKIVAVRNHGSHSRTYSITTSFRYPSDAASGAVGISAPTTLTVPAFRTSIFIVRLRTDAQKLPVWALNAGSFGGDGFRLQDVEFDGFITISDTTDTIRLPWHILPHRSAEVIPHTDEVELEGGQAKVILSNREGAVSGRVDVFSLLGRSSKIPKELLPGPGDHFAIIDINAVGARLVDSGSGPAIQFAINTFGRRAHANYPAQFDIHIDANRDGAFDYVVFNLENGRMASTGQNVVAVTNLATHEVSSFFFTDADLNSENVILTAPLSAMGLNADSRFDFSVFASDNYFTGNVTDSILGLTYTPSTPRFMGSGVPGTGVPAGGRSTLTIRTVPGGDVASPSQTGLLLMYRDAQTRREADTITIEP